MTKILVDKAVIEQALDALFMYKPIVTGVTFQHGLDAAKALRAALEQPQGEQEPVAWIENIGGGVSYNPHHEAARKLPDGVRFDLYTNPHPKREPLTDEAERQCPYPKANPSTRDAWLDGWEAAEREHGIGVRHDQRRDHQAGA